jgi:C-terminal processing protease CtpA/Prc
VNHNIGYISINNFQGQDGTFVFADKSYLIIDNIVNQFKDKDGIIIDVRFNGGGLPPNEETIACRFADQKRIYAKKSSKNGPGENDFSQWIDMSIEPQGPLQFTKPVVILTSRRTGSTAEYFTLAMKSLPQVTTVGDTTNGSISEQLWRELPNGWSYELPTVIIATPDLKVYNGRGIPPDIPIIETKIDSVQSIDRILEKGIEVIETKK